MAAHTDEAADLIADTSMPCLLAQSKHALTSSFLSQKYRQSCLNGCPLRHSCLMLVNVPQRSTHEPNPNPPDGSTWRGNRSAAATCC